MPSAFSARVAQWLRCCAAAGILISALSASGVRAQDPTSAADTAIRNRSWLQRLDATLVAGLFVRPVSLTLEGIDRDRATGLHGEFGLRTTPVAPVCGRRTGSICRVLSRITATPHISLGATHLGGIDARAGESAFSTFELLGVRVGYPVTRRIMPYAIYRRGKHSSEQFENGDVVNLWGSGSTVGGGIEFPITSLRRGLSIAWTQQRGRFDTIETRDAVQNVKVIGAANRSFRATSWQIGWSGPFTGVTWPWQ
jgi:hypothetical protein